MRVQVYPSRDRTILKIFPIEVPSDLFPLPVEAKDIGITKAVWCSKPDIVIADGVTISSDTPLLGWEGELTDYGTWSQANWGGSTLQEITIDTRRNRFVRVSTMSMVNQAVFVRIMVDEELHQVRYYAKL